MYSVHCNHKFPCTQTSAIRMRVSIYLIVVHGEVLKGTGIVLNINRGSPVLTLLVPLLVRLSNPLVQLWNRVVLDITICQAYPFLELSSNYIVFSSDFIKQSVAVKQHVISNIGNTGINHRLIKIQIDHTWCRHFKSIFFTTVLS